MRACRAVIRQHPQLAGGRSSQRRDRRQVPVRMMGGCSSTRRSTGCTGPIRSFAGRSPSTTPGGPSILQAVLINGGDSRITGVEIESAARLTRELELRATLRLYPRRATRTSVPTSTISSRAVDTSPDGRGRCRNVDGHYLEARARMDGARSPRTTSAVSASVSWNWFARARLRLPGPQVRIRNESGVDPSRATPSTCGSA